SVRTNTKVGADVVTGATISRPEYAHIIGHAAAYADAKGIAKAMPNLFAYSELQTNTTNAAAGAAAITAGVTCGILESPLDITKKEASMKATISAAIKAAVALTGPSYAESDGGAGTSSPKPQPGPAG